MLLPIFFWLADHSSDLVLIGTVDANQVVVSPKIMGRIERLAVDEGTVVKIGDTVAVLDSQELTADRQAAEALLASLRYQVAQTRADRRADVRRDIQRRGQLAGTPAGGAGHSGAGPG